MEKKTYTLNDGREVNIRPVTSEDREQLIKLYESMSPSALRWSQGPPSHKEIDELFRYPEYHINLVTEHDGRVIGYGEIKKDPEKRDGELQIHLHQDYHGVGLGTSMMIILLKDGTEQKLRRINLQVAADNLPAVRLFMKFGFQQERTTQEVYMEGKLHDTLHMARVLNG
ncbi:MAG: GNAT family N-acetyltransferase [Candidatus Bathyarchaeota archaeon]|nr:GNAT family N-acetyltransferase [Candidatus Bathyarchaeota archaeon]